MPRLNWDSQSYRDAKNHVYGLAHNVCENKGEQVVLLKLLQDTERDLYKLGMGGEKIIKTLLGIIYDGLAYGNWPWTRTTCGAIEKMHPIDPRD